MLRNMTALLLASGLVGWPGPVQDESDPLPLGRELARSLRIESAGGRALPETLSLRIDHPATYTLTVLSFDFKPSVLVFDADEELLGSATTRDEPLGAALELALDPGEYQVEIGSPDGLAGEYRLTVVVGSLPERSADEQDRATMDYYMAATEDAQQRGQGGRAASWQLRLGVSLFNRGDFETARAALARALALLPEEEDSGHVQVYATGYLGVTLSHLGQFERALVRLRESWLAAQQLDNIPFRFFIADNLGKTHLKLGQAKAAYTAFQRCQVLAEQHPQQPGLSAHALSRLALARERLGELGQARSLHEQALTLIENPRARSAAHLVARAAGRFFEERGEYERALECYQAALESAESWPDRTATRAQIAAIDLVQGRISAARTTFRALQVEGREQGLQFRAFDRDLRRVLASIAARLGVLEVALELREQILAEVEGSLDRRLPIDARNDLATVHESQGAFEQADQLYRRSIEMAHELGDATREARARINLSRSLIRNKRFEESEQMLLIALEQARGLQLRRLEATALHGLALCSLKLGRSDQASQRARSALELFSELSGADLLLGPLLTLALLALEQRDAEQVAGFLARADAIFTDGNFSTLRGLEAAGVRSEYHEWGQVAQDLTALRLEQAPHDSRAEILSEGFARAQTWKGRALVEGIRESSPETDRTPVDAPVETPVERRLVRLLGPDRILIEYVTGELRQYAYVIRGGGLEFFDLGPREPLEQDVQRYLEGIDNRSNLIGAAEIYRRAEPLFQSLLGPILDNRNPPPRQLVIVPSAQLARLPFEALVIRSTTGSSQALKLADLEFVVDRFDLTYGPSSAVLAELARRKRGAPRERILLMGDPLYSGRQTSGLPSSSRFSRLERTRDELKELATQLLYDDGDRSTSFIRPLQGALRNRSDFLKTPLFDLYLGGEATLAPLRNSSGAYRIIHLAAHGRVDPRDPRNTGIILSGDEHSSGLLGLDDVVTFGLDADLVVLSACSTARGQVLRGEGTQSMAYSFLRAHSRAVIASLFDVADREAADTMKELYLQHLGNNLPIARALGLAKQKVRRSGAFRGERPETTHDLELTSGAHPFYWAPFIYVGELDPPR